MHTKEQERDSPARVTALNSSRRDPSAKVIAQDSSWKTKENKSESERETPARELVQDGWSVPVRQSFEDFRSVDTAVCLVSRSEAEEAILELRSNQVLAILTTKHIFGSVEVKFEVKTARNSKQCGSDISYNWAPLLSRSNAQRQKVGTWRPMRHS